MSENISHRGRSFSGAIRLPNDTFKGNAGTEVVSDILFLQKRDRLIDIEPDWVHLDTDENGIRMNSYFVQHPGNDTRRNENGKRSFRTGSNL